MGFEYRGKAVAFGIVKKNRFAMEIPAPRMVIVKVSGKNNATFRVISNRQESEIIMHNEDQVSNNIQEIPA
jgi:hypothetical protein